MKLAKKLLSHGAARDIIFEPGSKTDRKEDASVERAEFEVKLKLYKEQIKKMSENIELYKVNIKSLKSRNSELETQVSNK